MWLDTDKTLYSGIFHIEKTPCDKPIPNYYIEKIFIHWANGYIKFIIESLTQYITFWRMLITSMFHFIGL